MEVEAVAVGTTSVRTLRSLLHRCHFVTASRCQPAGTARYSNGKPYETHPELSTTEALQQILDYMDWNQLDALHTSTQIIICTGIQLPHRQENGHQLPPAAKHPAVTGLSLFVKGNWRPIYDYALAHDFPLPELRRFIFTYPQPQTEETMTDKGRNVSPS